ncbi:MAG: apolipoprotein N-acyltransferase [Sandaracinus sp.]|nr:apolipoprotein N-acyltransferase [Sandaracinus sp.]
MASSKGKKGRRDDGVKAASDTSVSSVDAAPQDDTTELSRRTRWGHVGLVALGGWMQCLGFAGFSWWPFAFVCFLPMFWVLEREPNASTKRVLALGLMHGFVGYSGGYYWLVEMLSAFSGFAKPLCWAMASLFFFYQGLQQMLIYWLYRRARQRGMGVTAAAVPALLALELVFPTLFPSYLATGLHDLTYFIQTADLGGPMMVSAVVMACNGALYELLSAWRQKRPLPRRPPALALAGVVLTLGYGFYRVSEVDARAEAAQHLDVGVVQVNMGIFSKRDDPHEGHRRHLQQSARLEREHPELDLLVWPESAYTYFLQDGIENVRTRVLGPVQTPLLFGGLRRREGADRMYAYNTAYLTDGDGNVLGTYDKTYLLMFGEYLPFGETFPILYDWSPNSGRFTPGTHVRPLVLPLEDGGEARLSALVCYEDVLPGFTRQAVREGDPHLLVNVTNDAWFGDTHEPWIHLALAKFRAVEHHRALVRSTNSGVSAMVDPAGRVLGEIGVFERGELAASLPLLEGRTLYAHVGDWPGWGGLLLILWMAFVRRRPS